MDDPEVQQIAVDDLATTWRTLTTVANNYTMSSPGWAALVEARRLLEVEVREQHGDDAWQELFGGEV